jgi:hypothetical protein
MSKQLVSLGLIAAAMFANPAMAAWYDKNGAVVHPSRVVHCVRAPDTGQFAGGPWNNPPCEPATRGSGTRAAWRDKNGAVVAPSRVVHCVRAPDSGQFAGGPWNNPPCEPATWR